MEFDELKVDSGGEFNDMAAWQRVLNASGPVQPEIVLFCASVCAAPTLNAAGQSRATLSLRQER